jgi:hypothetical protein
LHDPVGREKLGGGGDVFAFDDLADDLVLLLTDVELVQPADDFDLDPIAFGNGLQNIRAHCEHVIACNMHKKTEPYLPRRKQSCKQERSCKP